MASSSTPFDDSDLDSDGPVSNSPMESSDEGSGSERAKSPEGSLKPASEEQKKIVDACANHNVIVDAVAGSGKTTTILHITQRYPNRRILQLTYNKKLRKETIVRAKKADITNLTVHTFNSFAWYHIGGGNDIDCATDIGIIKWFDTDRAFISPPEFDMLIVDECQDVTAVYHKLIMCINKLNPCALLAFFGDVKQSIYGHAGADPRYLTHAQYVCCPRENTAPWINLTLSVTYRLTRQVAEFANFVIGNERLVSAGRTGPAVRYMYKDLMGTDEDRRSGNRPEGINWIITDIRSKLDSGDYKPGDIFMLAPSNKCRNMHRQSPGVRLANALSCLNVEVDQHNEDDDTAARDELNEEEQNKNRILVHVMSDDENADEKVMKNKIIFSTFHRTKGLERKLVYVVNFDISYHDYFNRDDPRDVLPNPLYVAITRCIEELVVIHHPDKAHLPYVDATQLPKYAEVHGTHNHDGSDRSNNTTIPVTDILRNIPSEVCVDATRNYIITRPAHSTVIPMKHEVNRVTNGVRHTEPVSDINGVVAQLLIELSLTGTCTIIQKSIRDASYDRLFHVCADRMWLAINTRHELPKLTDITEFSAKYTIKGDGRMYRLTQLHYTFDWIGKDVPQQIGDRIKNHPLFANKKFMFEHPCQTQLLNIKITGRIDMLNDDAVVELKAVNNLSSEHRAQLLTYAYILDKNNELVVNGVQRRLYLYNVLTNESQEVYYDRQLVENMLRRILCARYHGRYVANDADFMNRAINDAISVGARDAGDPVPVVQYTCEECARLDRAAQQ